MLLRVAVRSSSRDRAPHLDEMSFQNLRETDYLG